MAPNTPLVVEACLQVSVLYLCREYHSNKPSSSSVHFKLQETLILSLRRKTGEWVGLIVTRHNFPEL